MAPGVVAGVGGRFDRLLGPVWLSARPGGLRPDPRGISDAFLTKVDDDGSELDYSTLLGGSDSDYGRGIALEEDEDAYVTGGTTSPNYPTTHGALDTTYGGVGDAFVTKVDHAGGKLDYSTYLGGTGADQGNDVAIAATTTAGATPS